MVDVRFVLWRSSPDKVGARERIRPSYLEGELPLRGVTIVLGGNSSGKTTLIELIEQSLRYKGWRPDPSRQLNRPQRAPIELFVTADLTPGSADDALLRSLRITHHRYRTLGALVDSVDHLTTADGLALAVYEEANYHGERPPPLPHLKAWANTGVFWLQGANDEWSLVADVPSDFDRERFDLYPFVYLPASRELELLPPVVTEPAEQVDISRLAEAVLSDIVEAWFPECAHNDRVTDPTALPPESPWVSGGPDGSTSLVAGLTKTADLLAREVTRLLPDFVRQEGLFRILPLTPSRWADGTRVVAGFQLPDRFLRAEAVGSGTRRWLGIGLRLAGALMTQWRFRATADLEHFDDEEPAHRNVAEAASQRLQAHQWQHGFRDSDLHRRAHPPVLLLDEPELHLHPDAIRSIPSWMSRRVHEGDTKAVVAATHSPSLLAGTDSDVTIAILRRQPNLTQIEVLDGDVLAALDEFAQTQGFGREAWFFATNAVLVVEGQHDLMVLQRFFTELLGRLRVRVLPLRGTKNTKRLIDSEFLGASGLPLYVLFDNVRLDAIKGNVDPQNLTDEEQSMWSLLRQAPRDDITFLPYDEPDILCSLPRATVARRYGNASADRLADGPDAYWTSEIDRWRKECTSGERISFKRWVAQNQLGLARGTDLVTELLDALVEEDRPSPALTEAVRTLEAHVTEGDLYSL
jgi:predicted ATPase